MGCDGVAALFDESRALRANELIEDAIGKRCLCGTTHERCAFLPATGRIAAIIVPAVGVLDALGWLVDTITKAATSGLN